MFTNIESRLIRLSHMQVGKAIWQGQRQDEDGQVRSFSFGHWSLQTPTDPFFRREGGQVTFHHGVKLIGAVDVQGFQRALQHPQPR